MKNFAIVFKTSWLINLLLTTVVLVLLWTILQRTQGTQMSIYTAEIVLKQTLFGVGLLVVNLALASQLSNFWQKILAVTCWFNLLIIIFYLLSILLLYLGRLS